MINELKTNNQKLELSEVVITNKIHVIASEFSKRCNKVLIRIISSDGFGTTFFVGNNQNIRISSSCSNINENILKQAVIDDYNCSLINL